MAEPWEIARAVAFLADEKSSYVTGQVLSVNGGLSTGERTSSHVMGVYGPPQKVITTDKNGGSDGNDGMDQTI